MGPNLYGTAAAAALSLTTLAAQSIDAIAVHFPQPLMAGGMVLPAGNYTISTLKGLGEVPILRFQNESGESIAVMVTREYLPIDEVSPRSEVIVMADGANALRVVKIAMEGSPYLFVVSDLAD